MKKTCVIGLGYIGLPTAVLLASRGNKVIGVDIDQSIISSINDMISHIKEADLDKALEKVVKEGNLCATNKVEKADNFLITVPTPFTLSENQLPQPDISYIIKAIHSIADYIEPGNLIILESTSPVGTTEKIANILEELTGINTDQLNIAYCPERVLPGRILHELEHNDRVIGGLTEKASILAREFYSQFCQGEFAITTSKIAELVKLTENAFRDVNIAFANELSLVCHQLDINSFELISLANKHPRVNILKPGSGVGGHCIAVDPWFIAADFPEITPLIQSARLVNDNKSKWVVSELIKLNEELKLKLNRAPILGCLGLTFKPNVDDLRESPALYIVKELIRLGVNIIACEPNIKNYDSIKLFSLDEVLTKSDLVVNLVEHSSFKDINYEKYHVFDVCGLIK